MQFFITATGTDIGKTFVLENICKRLLMDGKKVEAIKPIISGFDDKDPDSDSAKILKIFGLKPNKENLDYISPYRFTAALSPNIAAALENKVIDFEELVNFCKNRIDQSKKNNRYLFIEGAGGAMTPVTDNKTFADLISYLKIPAILVTGNYLGTISHTLTAISAMQSYDIQISKIVFNCREDDKIDAKDNLRALRNLTDIPISYQIDV
ncbi:MAG: dethiobiotin synthetase [Rickettsiaceae bacterium]|jgi:dethiobiotin synthetase|nr:dethiobiotin synthetase [Rickettsiaceae bacterium]